MKKVLKITVLVVVVLIAIIVTFAVYKHIYPVSFGIHSKVNQAVFSNVAINGYDPVAYFTESKAVKGVEKFAQKWNGATWLFSSMDNQQLFMDNPGKYAPQFGGYCAFALSKGFTANVDPDAFKIIDGKLYLCADQKFLNEWLAGGEESMKKSRQNWK